MRALITGGAGFVGRFLRAHLDECGDTVFTTDRTAGGPDITDRAATRELLENAEADIVYHLAGQAHVPTSWSDPIGTLRANAEGTLNVLDAAAAAGVSRCIAVTSAEVYGIVSGDDLPIDEDTPLRPSNPYAASKVAADALAMQAHLGRGQDVIRMRAFNHIGPGQRDSFVVAGLAARIAAAERTGARTIAVGNLTPRRDFTDVRDVVRAYRAVAVSGTPGEVYNVCSGIDRSVEEIADGLLAHADGDFELTIDPELARPTDVAVMVGDNSKLVAQTGWTPRIGLDDSLRDILADARDRLDG